MKMFKKKGGGGRSPRLTDPGPGLPTGNGYDAPGTPMPAESEINALFLEVMEGHGVSHAETQQALRHTPIEHKWEMILAERAKQAQPSSYRRGSTGALGASPPKRPSGGSGRGGSGRVSGSGEVESSAIDYAEALLAPGMPLLEDIKDLKVTLRAASKDWLEEFYEAGGLTALVMNLSDVEVVEEKSDQDVQIQVELLKCLKASLNNQLGIDFLAARPEVVGILALNFGSEDVFICTQALELLAVLMVDGPEGYRAVLAAMDYFKLVKGERVRFYSLLDALMSDETDVSFKRDVMLFINTLVNSAMDIEERVEIRADLIYTGILDAVELLKNQSVDAFTERGDEALSDDRIELDNQLQVFEAVMNKDIAEVQHSYRGDQVLNLSDPEQIFNTICSSVVEYDCFGVFLSIMQHLLVIPSADLAGKQQWEAAEEAIHQIVTHSDDEYSLTYDDLKRMLDWKERLEELSIRVDNLEKENGTLRAGGIVPGGGAFPAIPPGMAAGPPGSVPVAAPLPGAAPPRGAIPPPPSLPGMPMPPGGAIPPPPPLPGMPMPPGGAIPPPPPLPGMPMPPGGAIPPPPPLPGMPMPPGGAIPPPPPLPGMPAPPGGAIPPPPPLPGMPRPPGGGAVPPPPPLPGMPGKLPMPPPLPGMGRGPPMPPPMPGMVGLPGMVPGPPPMPGMVMGAPRSPGGPVTRPKKPSKKPDVAMRNLFWNKIPDAKIEGTIWMKLDKEMGGTDTKPGDDQALLDTNHITELLSSFCKNAAKKGEDDSAKKAEEERKKKAAAQQIALVDPKTAQNVGIALAKIRMSNEAIVEAVIVMDEKVLDVEAVKALKNNAPTAEDIGALKEFDGDHSKLGKVERFFQETMRIPRYAQRLDCMIVKLSFDRDVGEMEETLDIINTAVQQVKDSQGLYKLLKIMLATGNYLNGGTPRGGAYGFKMDVLKKFSELKDVTNKRHLMHYIANWCKRDMPDLLAVSDDFNNIEEATKMPLTMWSADFANISKGVKLVATQLELAKKGSAQAPEGDRFVVTMEPFLQKAQKVEEEMQKRFEETERMSSELMTSFAEDPKKTGIDDFMREVLEFLRRFDRAQAENEARELKEKKLREKKEKAEAKKKRMADKAQQQQADNLVDDVFGKLKRQDAAQVLGSIDKHDRRVSRARVSISPSATQGERLDATGRSDVSRLDSTSRLDGTGTLGASRRISAAGGGEKHHRTKTRVKDFAVDDVAARDEEIRRVEKFAANIGGGGETARPKRDRKTMLGRFRTRRAVAGNDGGGAGLGDTGGSAISTGTSGGAGETNAAVANFITRKKDKAARKNKKG